MLELDLQLVISLGAHARHFGLEGLRRCFLGRHPRFTAGGFTQALGIELGFECRSSGLVGLASNGLELRFELRRRVRLEAPHFLGDRPGCGFFRSRTRLARRGVAELFGFDLGVLVGGACLIRLEAQLVELHLQPRVGLRAHTGDLGRERARRGFFSSRTRLGGRQGARLLPLHLRFFLRQTRVFGLATDAGQLRLEPGLGLLARACHFVLEGLRG